MRSISAGFVAGSGGEQATTSSLWIPHPGRLQGMPSQAHSQMAALLQPTFGRRPENLHLTFGHNNLQTQGIPLSKGKGGVQ